MMLRDYDGHGISVVQKKTGSHVFIPCHTKLKAMLDNEKARATGLAIVTRRGGKPITPQIIRPWFGEVKKRVGLEHLQVRDLRRTTIPVALGEAGCHQGEIVAITGHSKMCVNQILETYLERTMRMAKAAILKLEKHLK